MIVVVKTIMMMVIEEMVNGGDIPLEQWFPSPRSRPK